jgi:PEGA domain
LIQVADLQHFPQRQPTSASPGATEPPHAFDPGLDVFAHEGADAVDSFREEEDTEAAAVLEETNAPAAKPRRSHAKLIAAAGVILALAAGGVFASRKFSAPTAEPSLGMLIVESSPPGVEIFVDGVSRGMTPGRLSLPAGSHILELRGRGVPRVIPVQMSAGQQISKYLEFADTPTTGMLVVHSQPAGAKVAVDGVAKGVTPLTLEGLEPGDHEVVLQNESGSSKHIVKVLAGTTASLVAPVTAVAPAEGPVSGWISVKAPFMIEIREDGQLLGTSDTDRLMLAAGRHVLELSNATLGFKESRTVQVAPGKVASIAIELPTGKVNLNATPWAEVWIDGRRVGETPIGNLDLPIGPHEVVFRHPELGEKRHAISVAVAAPVRVSVSMK